MTVGENGDNPPIIIYQYPEMNVVNILQNGTTQAYSRVDYSADGELLVSQGCDPDYMLTVWNWRDAEIILRCKSFSNDVINVMFSPTVAGHLTSCGKWGNVIGNDICYFIDMNGKWPFKSIQSVNDKLINLIDSRNFLKNGSFTS